MEGALDWKANSLGFLSSWSTKWCIFEDSSRQMTTYDKKGGARNGLVQVVKVYDILDRPSSKHNRIEIKDAAGVYHSMAAATPSIKNEWLMIFARSLGGLADLEEHPRFRSQSQLQKRSGSNTSIDSGSGSGSGLPRPSTEEVHTSNCAKYTLGQQVTGLPGKGEEGVSGYIVAITPLMPGVTTGPGVLNISDQPLRQQCKEKRHESSRASGSMGSVDTGIEEMRFDPETGAPIGGAIKEQWKSDAPMFDPETGLPIGGGSARQVSEAARFDPETGLPLKKPAARPAVRDVRGSRPAQGKPMPALAPAAAPPPVAPATGAGAGLRVKDGDEIYAKPRGAPGADGTPLTLSKLGLRYELVEPEDESDQAASEPLPVNPLPAPVSHSVSHSVSLSTSVDGLRGAMDLDLVATDNTDDMPRFDPETGEPINGAKAPAGAAMPRFDPETGERIA
jgi:hypothetical protein